MGSCSCKFGGILIELDRNDYLSGDTVSGSLLV